MDIETSLKEQVRLQDEKAQAAIDGKSRSGLVVYAKSYVGEPRANLSESFLNQSFHSFLKNREPPREILDLARKDGRSYEALRKEVTRLRHAGHQVPGDIKDFILDIELGVLKRPRKKGSKSGAESTNLRVHFLYREVFQLYGTTVTGK